MVAVLESVIKTIYKREPCVPDLLTDQVRLADLRIALPFADEQLSQEGVQGLLLTAELLASAAVLLVESAEEPLEHEESTLGRVSLLGWCDKDRGVLRPVGGVLGEGGGR